MKVKKAQGERSRTFSEIDLELPPFLKKDTELKDEIGDFLVESVLSDVGSARSPVKGEGWPSLSEEYREEKEKRGVSPTANMELSGEMLDSFRFQRSKDGIRLGHFNKEAWKADGHLKFSGEENNTPKRRYLPGEGQSFKKPIEKQINNIINDHIAKTVQLSPEQLDGVDSSKDLYSKLRSTLKMEKASRSEIRDTILRSDSLLTILTRAGVEGLL